MRRPLALAVCAWAFAGCTDDSARERLDQFNDEVDIVCWQYYGCANGGTQPAAPPSVPIDRVVTCMNDALASGARAVASWAVDDFRAYTETQTIVFTVDHQVKRFESHRFGENPSELQESVSCTGPFRVDEQSLCGAFDPQMPGHLISVQALAWDGCP